MKKNPAFRLRIMKSTYFKPDGEESLAYVVHDFGDPFSLQTTYAHMWRHQAEDLKAVGRMPKMVTKGKGSISLPKVASAVEGEVVTRAPHETALDAFIKQGEEKLERREMSITATNFLQAIKTRSEIDKTTKDRRMEMIKQFFAAGDKNDSREGSQS